MLNMHEEASQFLQVRLVSLLCEPFSWENVIWSVRMGMNHVCVINILVNIWCKGECLKRVKWVWEQGWFKVTGTRRSETETGSKTIRWGERNVGPEQTVIQEEEVTFRAKLPSSRLNGQLDLEFVFPQRENFLGLKAGSVSWCGAVLSSSMGASSSADPHFFLEWNSDANVLFLFRSLAWVTWNSEIIKKTRFRWGHGIKTHWRWHLQPQRNIYSKEFNTLELRRGRKHRSCG